MNFPGRKTKMSKKGNIRIIILALFFIILLVAVGITMFAVRKTTSTLTPQLKTQFTSSQAQTILDNNEANYPIWMERAVVIVFVGYWLLILLAAYLAPEHPLIALFLVIFIIVLAGVGAYVSNLWDDFAGSADYSAMRVDFPKTDFILTHYVEEIILFGMTGVYVYFYSSSRQSGVGGF